MKRQLLLFALLLLLPATMMAQGATWQSATLIASGSSGSGTLDEGHGDLWFKIEVPKEGRAAFTMTFNGNLSMNFVELVMKNGDDFPSRVGTGWYPDSGKTFEATDLGKGTYYLHAQRRGGSGTLTLSYQFTACPYANDAETNDAGGSGATLVSGKTVQGRLGYQDASGYRDDHDWYKIEVTQDGTVELAYACDQTYELELNFIDFCWYDASTGNYSSRAFTGWYVRNGKLTITDVGKGTYYFHMERRYNHGGYTLTYTFTPNSYANDAEPNDEGGQGTEIAIGQTVQGHLGYLEGDNYRDTHDWYKIQVPQEGRVDLVYACDQTYELDLNFIALCWYDASTGNYTSRAFTGWYVRNGTLTITDAAAGTYYIHMERRYNHGGYTLKYNFTPNSYANDAEPNDVPEQASEIAIGQTMHARIGYLDSQDNRDTHDWFKLQVPQDGRVQIVYDCDQTYELELNYIDFCWYDASTDKYSSRAFTGWYVRSDTLTVEGVGKGTYYLHVDRRYNHGGYTLKYIFTPNSYRNDTEPNDEMAQATQLLGNDETLTAHIGYLDGQDKRDTDDWFRLDTKNISAIMVITVEPDTTSGLDFNFIDIVKQKGDNTSSAAFSGWYISKPVTISVNDIDDDATYYLHVQRRYNAGGYTVTMGAPERFEGSDIRIAYVGRNTTRLGIPSPYEVKVENIGSGHTGSFFVALPATPDIEFLRAEIPTENGVMKVGRDDFAIYDADEGDCAVFVVPDLAPYQSYSFTVYMQGIVGNAPSRSELPPAYAFSLKDKTMSMLAALKSTTKKVYDNLEVRVMAEDGVSVALVQAGIDAAVFTEKERDQWSQVIGGSSNQWRQSYREPVAHPVMHFTQKIVEQANPVMAIPNALVASGKIANSLVTALRRKIWLWIYKDLGYIQDDPQVMDGRQGVSGIVRSWDPNEMCGPAGYGDENYIAETRTVDYRILFENKKEATAPAYRIRISDVLDENVFDVNSVRFGTTSHDGKEYSWKMNREGNKLTWDIEGIELPPNVNAPEGEGYVTFSVDLKAGLPNGTKIRNKASIIFDYNETIETNEYVNTLDLAAPVTTMGEATYWGGQGNVSCRATDSGSGVSHYQFFASNNGTDFMYVGQSTDGSYKFSAPDDGTRYHFYALAVDHVGNMEKTPPTAASVEADISDLTTAPATGSWVISRLNGTVVARGEGMPTTKLPAGVYIIRQGKQVHKVIVK